MDWWQSIILGIVEGLTEYLPVSSTGHLILAQRAMGIGQGKAADAYAICIQFGAIVAVLGLYRRRMQQMALGCLGRSPEGFRLAINVLAAFLPAAVLGVLFDDKIEEHLFGLWPVTAAWLAGGLAILAVHHLRPRNPLHPARGLGQLDWPQALVIGWIQCLALWPGTSRSLVTIVGGVLVGLSLAAAVEFSFILGVITLTAATVYKARSAGGVMLEAYGWGSILLGFAAAALSAALAVQWMVGYLRRHGLAIFGWYRVALALVVAALLLAGGLK